MSRHAVFSRRLTASYVQLDEPLRKRMKESRFVASQSLPAAITRAASKQTYFTIRFLADRDRVIAAFRAYAYFRWVDDWLDQKAATKAERLAFAERQRTLIDCCYRNKRLGDLMAEEQLLVDLIRSDHEQNCGLQSYIRNLMAVMVFDANRRGRLISCDELAQYSQYLSTGVTEAMHYCIGHDSPSPPGAGRYLAVTGAHVTHMLRDTFEDIETGYYNIPAEYLATHRIEPCDVASDAYRAWVESRVKLARSCFEAGKTYLEQVSNRRCRLAGYAYIARFTGVLDAIENDGYWLRPQYPERKSLTDRLCMVSSLLSMMAKQPVKRSSW